MKSKLYVFLPVVVDVFNHMYKQSWYFYLGQGCMIS